MKMDEIIIAGQISRDLQKKLPTIRIIEGSVNRGGSVAEIRLGSEVRYLPILDSGGLSSLSVR